MKKQEVIEILSENKLHYIDQFGINRIGLFGSVARDENNSESDIDIVIEMKNPSLHSLVSLKEQLEMLFNSSVDLVRYRNNMNIFLKNRIDREAIFV